MANTATTGISAASELSAFAPELTVINGKVATTKKLTAERIHELLNYDADTGMFTRKIQLKRGKKIGSIAGWVSSSDGYVYVHLDNKHYSAHRLAWLFSYGSWPNNEIDHLNGIRTDNRLKNLRDVSALTNQQNHRKARVDNTTSSLIGVSFHKRSGKYRATISTGSKSNHIGLYKTKEAAHAAYLAVKRQLHAGCTI